MNADDVRRLTKPAPPHNRLLAPAVCMCVDCCQKVLTLRCKAISPEGDQCGDYSGHRGQHTRLPATIWLHAEERVQIDGSGDAD